MILRILAPLASLTLLAVPAMAATQAKTTVTKHHVHVVKTKTSAKTAAKPVKVAAKTTTKTTTKAS